MKITRNPNFGNYVVLLFFIITGSILRIYNIGFQCLWTEEQYTLQMSRLPAFEIITTSLTTDVNPPVFYLLSHLSMILSGFVEIAIRYPSVITGILAIPAMYLLGRTTKDEITGLFCAGLTAYLFPLVYYSQFGRAYAASFLIFVVTLIFFIRIRKGDQRIHLLVSFGILAGLNIWTHLYAIIPVSLLLIDLLIIKKEIKPAIISGISCLPLLSIPFTTLHSRIGTSSSSGVGTGFGMKLSEILIITPREFFGSLFPYLTIMSFWGIYQERKNRVIIELAVIASITIIIGAITSFYTPFFPRYYLQVSSILILSASIACANLIEPIKSKNLKLLVIIGITILFLAMLSGEIMDHYLIQKYTC